MIAREPANTANATFVVKLIEHAGMYGIGVGAGYFLIPNLSR